MDEFIKINKLSSKFRSQCNVLCELKTNLTELRLDLLKGFSLIQIKMHLQLQGMLFLGI